MRIKVESLVLDGPVRPVTETGLTAQTGLTVQTVGDTNSAVKEAEDRDWRAPIISYLRDPDHGAERNIRCLAFKYIFVDDELYH